MADHLEVLVADGKASGGGDDGHVTGSAPAGDGDGDGEPRGSEGGASSSDGASAVDVGGDGGSSGDASDGSGTEYGGGTDVNGTNVSHGGNASIDPAKLREERCWNGLIVTSLETRGDVSLTALGEFPTEVVNLGEGVAWEGPKTKVLALRDFVFSNKVDDDDILIFTDGDDVSFGGCSCDYLTGVYWSTVNRSGRPIVFGSEVSCSEQDCRLAPQVPDWAYSIARRSDLGTGYWGPYLDMTHCSDEPWDDDCIYWHHCGSSSGDPLARCRDPQMQVASRYLNSGFIMGPVRDLKPLLQWAVQHYDDVSWEGADQSVFAAWWLQNQDNATLDYTGRMMVTLNHLMVTKALTIPEDAPAGSIWNEVADATACFYRYNGMSFPLGQALTLKAVGSMPVTVVTVSTLGIPALEAVGNFPYHVINMGYRRHWHGFYSKVDIAYGYVSTRLADDQLLVFVDGGDVWWGGCNMSDFVDSYWRIVRASGRRIVFGAEVMCGEQDCSKVPEVPGWAEEMAGGVGLGNGSFWGPKTSNCGPPWNAACARDRNCEMIGDPQHCPDPENRIAYRYLNSGFFMGYGADVMPMLEWVRDNYDEYSVGGRDQSVFASYWLQHQDVITLDYLGDLVLTLANLRPDVLEAHGHTVRNNFKNRPQCFYHGNGNAKDYGLVLSMEASTKEDVRTCSIQGGDCSLSLCCLDPQERCYRRTDTTSLCSRVCLPGIDGECSLRSFGAATLFDLSKCPTPPCQEAA